MKLLFIFYNKFCFHILIGYGLTETSPVVTFPHRGNLNLSTVGSPISNTLVKVIDIESGKTLGPNQGGEVCVKGPQVSNNIIVVV